MLVGISLEMLGEISFNFEWQGLEDFHGYFILFSALVQTHFSHGLHGLERRDGNYDGSVSCFCPHRSENA